MRKFVLIVLAAGFLGSCAREGLRPVLSYPRDIVPSQQADVPDVSAFEESADESP
jgi:hypothetical protein